MAQLQQSTLRNRLLLSMSPSDFAQMQPHLEAVTFEVRAHLFKAEQTITHVTFPERGIASIVAALLSRSSDELPHLPKR